MDPRINSNRNYSVPISSEAAGGAFKDTVQQRGDTGGLTKEKTMRGRALQKLCKVVFGSNNLTGTDFRDVMAWRVNPNVAENSG